MQQRHGRSGKYTLQVSCIRRNMLSNCSWSTSGHGWWDSPNTNHTAKMCQEMAQHVSGFPSEIHRQGSRFIMCDMRRKVAKIGYV
jgi:hypothetical protein